MDNSTSLRPLKDKISEERLLQLHPKAQPIFRAFLNECEEDPDTCLRITQGYRSFQEQQHLYNQGRSEPGTIVTNAQAGQSYHNYGLAIDLVEMDGPTNNVCDWKFDMGKLQGIAVKHQINWGGNFRAILDKPHFEISFGHTWQALLSLHNAGRVDEKWYVLI